jgi:NAD(P) transhydrogenase subunit alpha
LKIGIPKEGHQFENRVAMIPASVKKLTQLGLSVSVEKDIGVDLNLTDSMYKEAGAEIVSDRATLLSQSDIVLRIRKPEDEDIKHLKAGSFHFSYLDPFNEKDLLEKLKDKKINAVSMEMIPRTTIAQKMDVLSSQASLAGYVAVTTAASRLDKIFPMMMTPAGTIAPSKVFVIGAGVAGLQAIATAKRMGAKVEAFDTRPVVEEQVQSLGAKFVKIDLGEMGETKDGYAKALTEEQMQKQREVMADVCATSDVVITTAQLFGRKAPTIITSETIKRMKPGSVVIDLAVESGGNVEGSEYAKEVVVDGVKIIGLSNYPGEVAIHASQMYSSNLTNLLTHFWDKEKTEFNFDIEEEILKGCLITHEGEIVNERIK